MLSDVIFLLSTISLLQGRLYASQSIYLSVCRLFSRINSKVTSAEKLTAMHTGFRVKMSQDHIGLTVTE